MTAADISLAPRFLRGAAGHIFIQAVIPNTHSSAAVIMLPPLFEEMNKSRRMYSLQAQQFAHSGLAAITPDLSGLGDSEGDLSKASLEIWRGDLSRVVEWLTDSLHSKEIHLLALRSGALLLDLIDHDAIPIKSWTLWSPVLSGSRLVRDLFRQALIVARNRGDARIDTARLRKRMSDDGHIEISGYDFSADLLNQLDTISIVDPPPYEISIDWFDIRSHVTSESPVRIPDRVAQWSKSDRSIQYRICEGPPFWQTAEISISPELIEATCRGRAARSR